MFANPGKLLTPILQIVQQEAAFHHSFTEHAQNTERIKLNLSDGTNMVPDSYGCCILAVRYMYSYPHPAEPYPDEHSPALLICLLLVTLLCAVDTHAVCMHNPEGQAGPWGLYPGNVKCRPW